MIRINASFSRVNDPIQNDKVLSQLLEITPHPMVVGIDLLANERHAPALEQAQRIYGRLLKKVREGKSTLHRTMHSGELGDLRNPRDAIIMGAERLGHGVLLWQDPVTLEYALKNQIAIEANLTSNLKLQVSQSPNDSHFLKFQRLGLPVSLSTDDEGIFDTDINQECILAISETDIQYSEFKEMAFNGIKTSFADELLKKKLIRKLQAQFEEFESSYLNHRQRSAKVM